MTVEELRQRVIAACTALREKGFTIKKEFWGFDILNNDHTPGVPHTIHATCAAPEMACCAMGALALHEDLQVSSERYATRTQFIAWAIGVSPRHIDSFIEGFDNHEHTGDPDEQEWYDCGQSIYAELIGAAEKS